MINNQLLGYIKQQLSLKIGKEVITSNLKTQGWTDDDLNEAFSAVGISNTMPTPPSVPPISMTSSNTPGTPNFPQAQMVRQTNFSNETVPKSKGKKIFEVILVLVLLCAAGAGTYAYYTGFFVSFPKLISESMDKTRVVTSGSYDISVGIDLSELKNVAEGLKTIPHFNIDSSKIDLNFKGFSDISDLNNPKGSSIISLKIGSFLVEVELRVINNIVYAQITKIPEFSDSLVPSYLLENKWFSSPLTYAKTYVNVPLSATFGSSTVLNNTLTSDQKDRLYQIFRDAHIIKQVAKLNSEEMGGKFSYHFSFDLDKDAVVSYLQSLREYMVSIDKNDFVFEPDATSIRKALDFIKDFKGEIWIGRSDKLVHKFIVTFGVQSDLQNEQMKINLSGIMSDYNKPVIFSAPEDSVPLQTIIDASLQSARQKGREASIKANISSMRAQAEIFYDSHRFSYASFCLSKELKDARKSIETSGGTGFVCKDKATAYAIGVKLSETSGYWCVDSTGVSKSTMTSPSGTACPAI